MNTPLTLQQAEKICHAYQFLEGMPYDTEFFNTTPILSVAVAPYQEQAQQEFMDDYDLLGYTNIHAFDPSHGFDVIVIARYYPDTEICLWMSLRDYVKKNIIQVARRHKAYLRSANMDGITV